MPIIPPGVPLTIYRRAVGAAEGVFTSETWASGYFNQRLERARQAGESDETEEYATIRQGNELFIYLPNQPAN